MARRLSMATAKSIIDYFKNKEKTCPYFHVYDANNDGNHDYTSNDFSDKQHLCPSGAAKFSKRLDSIVVKILGK